MISLATEKNIPQLLEFMNLIEPWSEDRLRWQHFDNPAGISRLYVIWDEEKIVSLYAAVAHRVSLDGKIWAARRIQDVMTHPDYRGRGYMHMLAQQCAKDMTVLGEFGFTFPNKKSEGSFRRVGWLEYKPIVIYKRPTDGIVKSPEYLEWRYHGLAYSGSDGIILKRHNDQIHLCEMNITSWFPFPGLVPYETDRFMFTYPFKPSHWALTHGDSDVY